MTLFTALPANASPAYRNLRDGTSEMCRSGRQHCEDMWRDFERLGDCHQFLAEFPTRTHDRWFEMYVAVSLLRVGLDVRCPSPPGPDVLLSMDGRRIWIEATCPTGGAPGLPDSVEHPRAARAGEPAEVYSVPHDRISLRIRSALEAKQAAFRRYIEQGIVQACDALVIAINAHAIPHAWPDMDDMMVRAFYGVGHRVLVIDRDTRQIVDRRREQLVSIAKRRTGEPVGVLPLVGGSMPHISAVLGSAEDVVNRPRRLGDWFVLYPNLAAATPWDEGAIALGQEWTCTKSSEDEWQLAKRSHFHVPV